MINSCHLKTDIEDELAPVETSRSQGIQAYEQETLQDEKELERLLTQNIQDNSSKLTLTQKVRKLLFLSSDFHLNQVEPNEKIKYKNKMENQRKKRKEPLGIEQNSEEEVELLLEIEEGVFSDSSNEIGEKRKPSHRKRFEQRQSKFQTMAWQKKYLTRCLAATGLCVLLLLMFKQMLKCKSTRSPLMKMKSNGTTLFAPTTILISLDGFRPDFLNRGITPRLNSMRQEGFSPAYMLPSFPSVTFPNHYTLVTGLYPESHGIVSNVFWDEELKEQFYYTKPIAMNKKWWGGEPIWVTAEKQGVKTAVHMWPGSEAHIMNTEPTYLDKFNAKTTMKEKSERVLELLDKGSFQDGYNEYMRPQLIATYVPHVDADGHFYGPNTTEIRNTISGADQMLDEILLGLERRNLTNIVNVIVVSDHGMATTDIDRMIQLDDLLDLSKIDHIDGWPLIGLHPKRDVDVDELFEQLSQKVASNPNLNVYMRDKNMPERYHFSNNKRIAPIWLVPMTGWAITTKEEFDIKESKRKGLQYHPRGLHGYDHEHPLMHSIFIATGPAFPQISSNRIKPFQNTEVYNIVCYTLDLMPSSNNGTLPLPLLPIDPQEPDFTYEIPVDPEDSLVSIPLEDQNKTTISFPLASVTPDEISSDNLDNKAEINSSENFDFLKVGFNWLSSKETDFREWFEEISAKIKALSNKSLAWIDKKPDY
ncbi:putative type i phosphodiesterase nucleotide pyrophosphatase family protein [Erysiphe necator]|uniref:Putative type i phosphodiesterase nucleotide pyrophosphatase family protein n=1 Tax=Uncinula necator TaxID=52586 RepID=A0A0B1P2E4_UNCNE|nr:putative type i phosphodiesterase nucleotide pyrophosphatase family protein [Erysiphe necator]